MEYLQEKTIKNKRKKKPTSNGSECCVTFVDNLTPPTSAMIRSVYSREDTRSSNDNKAQM